MRLTYLSGALAGVLVAACGGTPLTPEDPPPSQTEPDLHPMTASAATALDESKCAEGGVRQRPFVVNWDATDQAAFSAHIQDSLALVKAEGCKLELLPLCTIPGEYRLHETDGNLQSLTIGSEDQLYAELPLGFASLSGHLKQSGSLSLRYFVRGTKTATGARLYRSQLGDGCEGATHLVVNYAAGAYELASARHCNDNASQEQERESRSDAILERSWLRSSPCHSSPPLHPLLAVRTYPRHVCFEESSVRAALLRLELGLWADAGHEAPAQGIGAERQLKLSAHLAAGGGFVARQLHQPRGRIGPEARCAGRVEQHEGGAFGVSRGCATLGP